MDALSGPTYERIDQLSVHDHLYAHRDGPRTAA